MQTHVGIHLQRFALLPRMLMQVLRGRRYNPWSVPMRRMQLHRFNSTNINEVKGHYMWVYNEGEEHLQDIRRSTTFFVPMILFSVVFYGAVIFYLTNNLPNQLSIPVALGLLVVYLLSISGLIGTYARMVETDGYLYVSEFNHTIASSIRQSPSFTLTALRWAYTPKPPKKPPVDILALRKPYLQNQHFVLASDLTNTVNIYTYNHPAVFANQHHHALWHDRSAIAHGVG